MARTRLDRHAPRVPPELARTTDTELVDDLDWSNVEVAIDLAGAAASDVDINESRLVGARLTGTHIQRIQLTDTIVEDCELSGAIWEEAVLTRVEFRNCRMSAFVLARAVLRDVRFAGCRLDDANFRMVKADHIEFDDCVLTGFDLYGAKLTTGHFFDCDLTGSQLSQAELTDIRMHGSTIDELRGGASLHGVTIDSSQIVPVALRLFGALGITVDDERAPTTPVEVDQAR